MIRATGAAVGAGALSGFTGRQAAADGSDDEFDPVEATASEVRSRSLTGRETVQSIVERYLERIWAYEDELEAVITVNPNVLERVGELDAALESDGPVGPLHGIPLLIKDNHDTADMPTTAGSVSLAESRCAPPRRVSVGIVRRRRSPDSRRAETRSEFDEAR